jgi:hypothetical protein
MPKLHCSQESERKLVAISDESHYISESKSCELRPPRAYFLRATLRITGRSVQAKLCSDWAPHGRSSFFDQCIHGKQNRRI